jgi:cation:H+ antiporter
VDVWQSLALFLVAASIIAAAGIVLARAGDQIATQTGLGGLLVGMLLLAVATSLPELATDVSAVAQGAPDLAVGDLFGSSMATMAILAVIDLVHRGRVWPSVGLGHARLAAVAIGLTSLAVIGILVPSGIAVGWVGADTIVIVVAYAAAAAWIHRSRGEGRRSRHAHGEIIAPTGWSVRAGPRRPLRAEVARFGLAAGVILVTAPVLAVAAGGLADATGLADTFVGVVGLAVTTSLPELVASLAAVRIAAYDLAVGNLFGSNAVNITILFAADLAYTPGPILAAVSPAQVVAAVGAILLMAVALAAVVHGTMTRIRRLEPDALVVLGAYAVLLVAVLRAG